MLQLNSLLLIQSNTIDSNSLIGVLKDTDTSSIPSQYTLSASQNQAFHYIDNLLSTMDTISNEETENDIEDIEGNIVSFFMCSILNCIRFNIYYKSYISILYEFSCFSLTLLSLFRKVLKMIKDLSYKWKSW